MSQGQRPRCRAIVPRRHRRQDRALAAARRLGNKLFRSPPPRFTRPEPDLWASARSPQWRRRGPGSGSAPGGTGCAVEVAWPGAGPAGGEGGRRPPKAGDAEQTSEGTRTARDPGLAGWDAGCAGPKRRLLSGARRGQGRTSGLGVLTAREPWGTDSDGAKLTSRADGVLTARARWGTNARLTAREPAGTDSDGANLTIGALGY